MKKRILLSLSIILLSLSSIYGQLSGHVTDAFGENLPYVNIYVKGTTIGTTTNFDGYYQLKLDAGQYDIVFQYVGFKTVNKSITLTGSSSILDISLEAENYTLDEVTISANAEDPAYAIIRQAQARRKYYKNLTKEYQCDAYVRGFNKILDAPEKILGFEIGDMDGLLDSTRQGVVYLSESVSKLYYREGDYKEVMYSSKISGNDQGYSFNSAKEMSFDFYGNTIDLNRKIISPIASGAMAYYDYKLEGADIDENGQLVNKIRVIPKNDFSPCFYGYVYINEDLWNYHSLELGVTSKATQLPFIDSLVFKQVFVPLNKDQWMPFSNVVQFKMKALGFILTGNFAAVYSNYDLSTIEEGIFNSEVFKVEKEANERSMEYWDTLRPIPLTVEESRDYVRKDSIQKVKESPAYLDSVDRENNRFKIGNILGGYSHQNSQKRSTFEIDSPISKINVNTIQGWNFNLGISYSKSYNKQSTRRLTTSLNLNYGFSEKVFRPAFVLNYRANLINNLGFRLRAGKAVTQFNRLEPISESLNTILTYFFRYNYLKAYDREYISLEMRRDLGNIFLFNASLDYEQRSPLVNNFFKSVFNKESQEFTSNDPRNPANNQIPSFDEHKALIFRASLRIKIGEKVWRYPDRKFRVGSDWPTIRIYYKKGIKALGGDVDFDLVYATISKQLNLSTLGTGSIYAMGGSYLGDRPTEFIDYFHFYGNQTHIGNPFTYGSRFLMLPYYSNSTNGDFYQLHLQHNFKGFLLSKLPLFKQLGWHLAGGYKLLNSNTSELYQEIHFGIDNIGWNIFRMFRTDFVWSKQNVPSSQGDASFKFGVVVGLKMDF